MERIGDEEAVVFGVVGDSHRLYTNVSTPDERAAVLRTPSKQETHVSLGGRLRTSSRIGEFGIGSVQRRQQIAARPFEAPGFTGTSPRLTRFLQYSPPSGSHGSRSEPSQK
jgi:hypothetical protein